MRVCVCVTRGCYFLCSSPSPTRVGRGGTRVKVFTTPLWGVSFFLLLKWCSFFFLASTETHKHLVFMTFINHFGFWAGCCCWAVVDMLGLAKIFSKRLPAFEASNAASCDDEVLPRDFMCVSLHLRQWGVRGEWVWIKKRFAPPILAAAPPPPPSPGARLETCGLGWCALI